MNAATGQVTWAVLLPVIGALVTVIVAQGVTLYIARATQKVQATSVATTHQAALAKDLRAERVTQYAQCLTATRALYSFLEGFTNTPSVFGPPPAPSTQDLGQALSSVGLQRLDAFNQAANGVRLLSGASVATELGKVEQVLSQSIASRVYRPDVSTLPDLAGPESRLIFAMSAEVQLDDSTEAS